MRQVITESVILPAPAETLFAMFLDPEVHAAITGSPVTIDATPGSDFRAFFGALSGKTLSVIEPRLIVQSWRSSWYRNDDPDATVIIHFESVSNGGQITLIHLDVPVQGVTDILKQWEQHYWSSWRKYLLTNRVHTLARAGVAD